MNEKEEGITKLHSMIRDLEQSLSTSQVDIEGEIFDNQIFNYSQNDQAVFIVIARYPATFILIIF